MPFPRASSTRPVSGPAGAPSTRRSRPPRHPPPPPPPRAGRRGRRPRPPQPPAPPRVCPSAGAPDRPPAGTRRSLEAPGAELRDEVLVLDDERVERGLEAGDLEADQRPQEADLGLPGLVEPLLCGQATEAPGG